MARRRALPAGFLDILGSIGLFAGEMAPLDRGLELDAVGWGKLVVPMVDGGYGAEKEHVQ